MSTKIKYLIVFMVTVLYLTMTPSPWLYNSICVSLVLLFGIPHGAADHKINATINKNSKPISYIIKYVLIAVGYTIWWVFMPGKALVVFFILSAYHFGQEFLEDNAVDLTKPWETMIWGSSILIAPLLISYAEIRPNLEFVTKSNLPDLSSAMLMGITTLIFGVTLIHSMYLWKTNRIDTRVFAKQLMLLLTILVSYSLLPFLIAFTLYFVLFHSLNAFKHQFDWLQANFLKYTVKSFLRDLSLFSFISITGILGFLFFMRPDSWPNLISYFFILISVITLPHSILFDQFYKFKKSQHD